MRNSFLNELLLLAEEDERVWLLTADLGFGVLEPFSQRFPDRFVNVGIAEQNMTGIAAGLALDGRIVFTYSIANFSTLRCLEQIRNDVCHHNLDVRIISVGAGLSYGSHGYTHFGIEDLAIMRALPNMSILSPADPVEARSAARLAVQTRGPMYIRLGKNGEPSIHDSSLSFNVGQMVEVAPAGDITFITVGSIASQVAQAASMLRGEGFSTGFFTSPSVTPFDGKSLREICRRSRLLVTVEEHVSVGGLASIVAEQLVSMNNGTCSFMSLTLPREIQGVGTQEFLLQKYQLDAESIARTVRTAFLGEFLRG